MLAFAGLYQVPMVGSDVYQFRGDTAQMSTLHAKRATLVYENVSPFGCMLKRIFEKAGNRDAF